MLLFFDTETTGIPRSYSAPVTDTRNWPRLVQLAWALYEPSGAARETEEHLIRPEGFTIPAAATRLHGITTADAKARGEPLGEVFSRFLAAIGPDVETLVGHNLEFDRNIVGAEFVRLGFPLARIRELFLSRPGVCTMRASTHFCRIPGQYGKHKFPTLAELHYKLFDEEPKGGHTALEDVLTSAKCYFRLREMGVI